MSDEVTTLNIKARVVMKISPVNKNYAVFERKNSGEFVQVSKGYRHSTSCYARLGRMTNADVWPVLRDS